MNAEPEDALTDAEIAKRRDEVIRRMANTPPKPKPAKKKPDAAKTTKGETKLS